MVARVSPAPSTRAVRCQPVKAARTRRGSVEARRTSRSPTVSKRRRKLPAASTRTTPGTARRWRSRSTRITSAAGSSSRRPASRFSASAVRRRVCVFSPKPGSSARRPAAAAASSSGRVAMREPVPDQPRPLRPQARQPRQLEQRRRRALRHRLDARRLARGDQLADAGGDLACRCRAGCVGSPPCASSCSIGTGCPSTVRAARRKARTLNGFSRSTCSRSARRSRASAISRLVHHCCGNQSREPIRRAAASPRGPARGPACNRARSPGSQADRHRERRNPDERDRRALAAGRTPPSVMATLRATPRQPCARRGRLAVAPRARGRRRQAGRGLPLARRKGLLGGAHRPRGGERAVLLEAADGGSGRRDRRGDDAARPPLAARGFHALSPGARVVRARRRAGDDVAAHRPRLLPALPPRRPAAARPPQAARHARRRRERSPPTGSSRRRRRRASTPTGAPF